MQKLHPKSIWIFFVQNLVTLIFLNLILFSWIFAIIFETVFEGYSGIFGAGILNLVFWIGLSYGFAKWSYNNWKYELSEDALKIEKGVIWKKYVSIPYERIQNVDINRGILDRIIGLSDIQMQTAGYSGYPGRGLGAGMFSSEGRLPGLLPQDAELLRDDLIKRAKGKKSGV